MTNKTLKTKKKLKVQNKKSRNKLAITLSIVIGVGICLLIFLFINHKDSLVSTKELKDSRSSIESSYRQLNTDRSNLLVKNGLTVGTSPNYNASIDTCSLATIDAGWTIQSWKQVCNLKDIYVFQTDLPAVDIKGKLSSDANASQLLGSEVPYKTSCERLYTGNGATLSYLSVLNEDTAKSTACSIPNITDLRDSDRTKTKVISSINVDEIDRTKNYLLLETDIRYFDKNIGCKTALSVWCSRPIESPRTDF